MTLVDCDHIGWKSWKLIIRLLVQHIRSLQPKGDPPVPPTPRGTWENLGETIDGVGKNGVLENKSGNISETCKDGGKVTMEDL